MVLQYVYFDYSCMARCFANGHDTQRYKTDDINGLTCHKTLSLCREMRAPDSCECGSGIYFTRGLRFLCRYSLYNKYNVLVKYTQKH